MPPERRRKEPADTLTGDQTTLLGVLKVLRLELAKERGVKAYVVFHDRTLIDMARRRPRTKEEFAEVNGVGAAQARAVCVAVPGRHRRRALRCWLSARSGRARPVGWSRAS